MIWLTIARHFILLAWTVFLLALHTDWQEEARKEVLQLFGKQTPNLDGIGKLTTVRNLSRWQKYVLNKVRDPDLVIRFSF